MLTASVSSPAPSPDIKRGLLSFLGAACFAGYGAYEYFDLADWEVEGGSRRLHTLVRMLYSIGGKIGVLALFLVLALALVWMGVNHFRGR